MERPWTSDARFRGVNSRLSFSKGSQDLSRRARILLISVILLALGLELAVWLLRNSRTSVEIANMGQTPIEELVVTFGGSHVGVGHLSPGDTTRVALSGREKGTLSLSFTQAGNPMSGFLLQDFDPRSMHSDGLRMVLQIKSNEVVKFMDDETATTPLGRLRERISDWVSPELIPLR
jgi:hypothetical protein